MHRPRFDPKRSLVAARDFTFMGQDYEKGHPFAPEGASDRLRARQYETRLVNYAEDEPESADPVQMTGPSGGRYTITAPWLKEPEVVRGKVNAEARLAELRKAGPPDDHSGEQDPPSNDDDHAGQTGGDDQESEDTVKKDPNERAEELGNQPNNSEQAADEQRAGTEGEGRVPAGTNSEGHAVEQGEDESDGTGQPVGP